MQIKVKDLLKFDPESVIRISGGHVEYMTDDAEVVEENGVVTITESSRINFKKYAIHDLPGSHISGKYDKLVLFKTYNGKLSELIHMFPKDYSGTIIIDALLSSGNASNRFIEAIIENGTMLTESVEAVQLQRKHPLRVFSNSQHRYDPESLSSSILMSHQQKLLLKGVSI